MFNVNSIDKIRIWYSVVYVYLSHKLLFHFVFKNIKTVLTQKSCHVWLNVNFIERSGDSFEAAIYLVFEPPRTRFAWNDRNVVVRGLFRVKLYVDFCFSYSLIEPRVCCQSVWKLRCHDLTYLLRQLETRTIVLPSLLFSAYLSRLFLTFVLTARRSPLPMRNIFITMTC